MRHRKTGKQLSRTDAHRKAMLRNMVCSLFITEPDENRPRRVTTTVPKAKMARRVAEHAITLGKRGTLCARRRALALLVNKAAVKHLFETVAPLYAERVGGYTRIVRLSKSRVGDGSELCYLELMPEGAPAGQKAGEPVAPKVAEKPAGPQGAETPAAAGDAAKEA
jgi:large subunit ribosomal protein L17